MSDLLFKRESASEKAEKVEKKETKAQEREENGRLFIIREFPIDRFTVLRRRRALLPSTCDFCGFDICEHNKLGDFFQLEEGVRVRVLAAVQEHKRLVHTTANKQVISELEMPVSWLGRE
ncbi:MAG: hypothetical protein QW838_02855 [Candidatus Nitrosotenuis sp.]